ncbi:MAG: hypothetical protein ACI8PZ_000805 [Myxococcota bacterium]|jgi:hypothetical protein
MLPLLLLATANAAPFLQPVIGLVPPTGVVGDGSTPVEVFLIARDKDGTPIEGSTLRANAKLGRVGPLSEVGGGVYTFLWTPPKAATPSAETLIVKGKTPDKRQVDLKVAVPLQMEAPYALGSSSSPADLVPTTTVYSTVTFSGGTWGGAPELRTCGGSLDSPMSIDEGAHKVRYSVGRQGSPRLAIVTASDNAAQLPTYGYHVLPLLVARAEAVTTTPRAQLVLRLGEREFGPITASSSGQASVPVQVPPGLANADMLVRAADGVVTRSAHPLQVKESQQICLLPPAKSIPVGAEPKPKVRMVVLKPDGTPDVNAKPTLTASVGTVGEILPVRDGIFEAAYTPPDRAQSVTFQAGLGGGSVQRDSVSTQVIAAKVDGEQRAPVSANPPAAVVLVGDAVVLGGTTTSVNVVAVDAWGHPVPNAVVSLTHDSRYAELPESVTTDRYGLAIAELKSGEREEMLTIQAQSGVARGALAVITSLEPVDGIEMPISGDRARVALETWWRAALAE